MGCLEIEITRICEVDTDAYLLLEDGNSLMSENEYRMAQESSRSVNSPNKKISELTPLEEVSGEEVIPVAIGEENYGVKVSNIGGDMSNYYTKENLYNKTEVDAKLSEYAKETISLTYAELVARKGTYIPGLSYRITDYETLVNAEQGYISHGHRFDIIVTAIDADTLSHDARAARHIFTEEEKEVYSEEEQHYFDDSNLAAWELKYDIENDIRLYPIATDGRTALVDWIGEYFYKADETIRINDVDYILCRTYDGKFLNGYTYVEESDEWVLFLYDGLLIRPDNWYLDFTMTPSFFYNSKTGDYATQEESMDIYVQSINSLFGKGVIYRMKDEFGNEAGCDFKNIGFLYIEIVFEGATTGNYYRDAQLDKIINGEKYYGFSRKKANSAQDFASNEVYFKTLDITTSTPFYYSNGNEGSDEDYGTRIQSVEKNDYTFLYGDKDASLNMDCCRNIIAGRGEFPFVKLSGNCSDIVIDGHHIDFLNAIGGNRIQFVKNVYVEKGCEGVTICNNASSAPYRQVQNIHIHSGVTNKNVTVTRGNTFKTDIRTSNDKTILV